MDSIVRNVGELSDNERHLYESVLGLPLRDDQRVIVQLADADTPPVTPAAKNGGSTLPTEYAIWADLSDAEIVDLESVVLQRSESRPV